MKIAITGASGFAGQAITRRLLAEGHTVRALVRRPAAFSLAGAEARAADLADPRSIATAARECDVLVHAAAETHPGSAAAALGWRNVAGTENAINAARHAGIERFVHVSCTDATLVAAPRNHWKEDHVPLQPLVGELARSKQRAEEVVIGGGGIAGADGSIDIVILRPGMLWGAGDERSRLPRLCGEAIATGSLSLCGDGTNLVATTHVDNLAEAVHRALVVESAAGGTFHVLDGELALAQDFLGDLAEALSLAKPTRPRLGFRGAYAAARLRARLGQPGLAPDEVLRRGQSAHLSVEAAREVLDYRPPMPMHEGFAGLRAWAEEVGGAVHLASLERRPADAESVAAQVDAAFRS